MDVKTAVEMQVNGAQPSSDETAKEDYKALITNVPFTKGNRLDYRSLIPLPVKEAGNWVWLLFISTDHCHRFGSIQWG